MSIRFIQLNEKPMRFMTSIEEAEWNEAWGVYFSIIYLSQKVLSDCAQEITIREEAFTLLIEKEIYEAFEKNSAEWEYDYYGRLLVTIDGDLYLESLSNNAYCLRHHLKVLQMAPYGNELPPYIRPIIDDKTSEHGDRKSDRSGSVAEADYVLPF